ncbi:MAG: hypothetical protein K9L17_00905 [Clostridiales bacterium]|nr:hypothetical protein [Clostridiales bacterium]MCF8021251.1 hypothetical protein [Clostridiales bacterium]
MLKYFFLVLGKKIKRAFISLFVLFAVCYTLVLSFTGAGPLDMVIGDVDLKEITVSADNLKLLPGEPAVLLKLKKQSRLPGANILLNGENAGSFKNNYYKLLVHNGDVIKIDVSDYNYTVCVQVTAVSPGITSPEKGKAFKSNGDTIVLDRVRIDNKFVK